METGVWVVQAIITLGIVVSGVRIGLNGLKETTNQRFDAVDSKLVTIEKSVSKHGERLATLEERTAR